MLNNIFDNWFYAIIACIVLFAVGNALYKAIIRLRPQSASKPSLDFHEKLPAEGFTVPIVDAYGGIKDDDRATVTQNFQKPKLILFDDHLVYKLFFRRSAKYSDILEVNCGSELMLYFLQFTFNNRTLVLNVTIGDEQLYKQVKEFLSAKGVMVIE